MAIDPKLIDQLLADHGRRPQDIAGETGVVEATDEGAAGTGDEGGTDRPSGV